jgi:ferredoxin
MLDWAEREGLVLQPENNRNPLFICCCGVLRMLKKFLRPAERVHVNYFAEANHVLCAGCGLCVSTCTSDAVDLVRKGREVVPPKDHDAMYRRIMMKIMGKSLLGGKL